MKLPLTSLILIFVFGVFPNKIMAQSSMEDGYALFLYNFAKYSVWPEDSENFKFLILGNNDLTNSLNTIALNKNINGRKIVANNYQPDSDLDGAHIIFVGNKYSNDLQTILKSTEGKSVMVVTEKPGNDKQDACISFDLNRENRLKFSLNEKVLKQNKLKMATSLKSMAK